MAPYLASYLYFATTAVEPDHEPAMEAAQFALYALRALTVTMRNGARQLGPSELEELHFKNRQAIEMKNIFADNASSRWTTHRRARSSSSRRSAR